jgi:tetratricopeptide (TPR) repeat protein
VRKGQRVDGPEAAARRPRGGRALARRTSLLLVLLCVISQLGVRAGWAEEARGIRILVVASEAEARRALEALQAGTPFPQLVRERSTGPAREAGGYLGRVDPDTLTAEARAALAATPRGGLSPITPVKEGFAIFQVLGVEEERALEARARNLPEALALLEQGTRLARDGDLEGAAAALARAIELDPDLTDAHFNLAVVERRRGRPDAAIAALQRVIELVPDDVDAYVRLGLLYFDRKAYGEAIEAYGRAATYAKDSLEAWVGLAESYELSGNPAAAVPAYQQAIALAGKDERILYPGLYRTAMQAGNGPVAVQAARKLQTFQGGHDTFLALGDALLLNGEPAAAITEFQKAAALRPTSARAFGRLGAAYARAGQTETAIQQYVRAVQLAPEDPTLYRELARVYADVGQVDLAIVTLRDGVTIAKATPALQAAMADELAALYERAGMAAEAAQERERARSLRAR